MEVKAELVTLSAVREQFCVQDKKEFVKLLVDGQRERIDMDMATDLLLVISKNMAEALEADGVTFTPIEKMTWIVKEAFIAGVLDMAEKMLTVNDQGYEALAAGASENK